MTIQTTDEDVIAMLTHALKDRARERDALTQSLAIATEQLGILRDVARTLDRSRSKPVDYADDAMLVNADILRRLREVAG